VVQRSRWAAHPVIWTYYGYPDLAKIAGEVVTRPARCRACCWAGLAATAVLYLALNAAFFQVLPLERIRRVEPGGRGRHGRPCRGRALGRWSAWAGACSWCFAS